MIIDLKEEFLVKSFDNGNVTAGRDLYDIYKDDKGCFHKAADLFKQVLTRYEPSKAIKTIYPKDNFDSLTGSQIEDEYIYAISCVARYNRYYGDEADAYLWAKKGLELFEIFNKSKPESIKNRMKASLDFYSKMKAIHDEFKQASEKNIALQFDWEKEYLSVPSAVNDNHH